MIDAILNYCKQSGISFGEAWNRFWYTPSDPATLGLMRLLTGLLLVLVCASYTPDLNMYFATDGVTPPETVHEFLSPARQDRISFSYFFWLESPTQIWVAHLLSLTILMLFAVGFKTRVTSVMALIVALSYLHRTYLVKVEAEPILALLIFYLALAPSGAAFSVDAWLARRRQRAQAALRPEGKQQLPALPLSWATTIATRLMQIHLTAVYLAFGFSKLVNVSWWDGSAVWLLISRSESQAINLTWMHAYFPLVELWTHLILAVQLAYPVLVWRRGSRPVMQVFCALMWLSIIPLTGQWSVALAMVTANLAFVSPAVLRTFWKLLPGMDQQSLDSVCPPCDAIELSAVISPSPASEAKQNASQLEPQLARD